MANSKIYLGSTNIGSLFQGADDISIYLGDEKVYPLEEPTLKWLATYSDQSVQSAECDSSSAITYNEITKSNLVSVEIGDCVTTIGNRTFFNCTSLTSCTIGSGVTSIGTEAFKYCSVLTSIDIPDSVTSIGYNAFEGCSGLTSIVIPNSVTSIGSGAFRECNSLTSCTIGSGVTSIGYDAFKYCSGLTSIVIPNSVTSIGYSAFTQCYSLTSITIEAVTPPTLYIDAFDSTNNCPIYVPCESVEAYKSASGWSTYADRIQCIQPPFEGKFKALYSGGETYELACDGNTTLTTTNTKPTRYEYSAMTEAVIGDYCVTNIGSSTFYNCISLTSCTIGSGVTSIGNYAFYNCSGLTSIDIPSGITTINDGTFEGCSGLTSIDIPSGVTTISGSAFSRCSSLTSIEIPSGVTTIGGSAFSRCSSLTSVTVNATTPPALDGDFVFYSTNNCPIYCSSQSVEAYKTASGWSEYSSRIQAIPNS